MSQPAAAGPASAAGVRARLLQQLGTMPPRRAPQPPRVTRVLHEDGLRFEHWWIAGPRDEIPAWFVSSDTARTPATTLLALHPHGRQFEVAKSWVAGLAGDRSRAYGRAAAAHGFAVLIPDLPGFEEHRPPLAERKSSYALQGETYERLLANSALVQGSTLQAWILADLRACVDVLENEPRADARRIGVIGHSYGGQECIFAMLSDDRLRAGVASCGFSLVQLLVDRRISHNMALYVPGLLPDLDFDVLLPALAPRPVCVIAGRDDPIYPVAGVERVAQAARAAWAAAGAAPAFQVRYFAGPHDLPASELDFALGWLQQALRETE